MAPIQFLRPVAASAFLIALTGAFFTAGSQPETEARRYDRLRRGFRGLVERFPDAFEQPARIADFAAQLSATDSGAVAWMRIGNAIEASPAYVRVTTGLGTVHRKWETGTGLLLLHSDSGGAGPPAFVMRTTEGRPPAPVELPSNALAALIIEDLPSGIHKIEVKAGSHTVPLMIEVPAPGRLTVRITDAGSPTAAVAGLYGKDGGLLVPDSALSFLDGGFRYADEGFLSRRGKARANNQVHYWPDGVGRRQVFFTDGGFTIDAPAGDYTLVVGKGFEYTPVVRKLRIAAGANVKENVAMERWIDMPARGWYSGDGHVHYERKSASANQRLLTWARAEDVHAAHVMRMGDAQETYFEQYAFGPPGRAVEGSYALIPGHEDPRTTFMGHTLHMNMKRPVRNPDLYYLYDRIFADVREQGGISGYAHFYQPAAMSFYVRRDATLQVPFGGVGFVEMPEFGEIDSELYHEFLNLGYRLIASAGSDVPWGHSIGTSRVYAYTGGPFDPDRWMDAFRKGHTFVSTGPILELTVNGQIPGSEINAKRGERIEVRARAMGKMVPPRNLEILVLGGTVASAQGSAELSASYSTTAQQSMWIAARCAGAHTTPVYVKVNGGRTWNKAAVPALVERRMRQLDDVELLIAQGVPTGRQGNWDGPESLRRGAGPMRERVAAARRAYQDLLTSATKQ